MDRILPQASKEGNLGRYCPNDLSPSLTITIWDPPSIFSLKKSLHRESFVLAALLANFLTLLKLFVLHLNIIQVLNLGILSEIDISMPFSPKVCYWPWLIGSKAINYKKNLPPTVFGVHHSRKRVSPTLNFHPTYWRKTSHSLPSLFHNTTL